MAVNVSIALDQLAYSEAQAAKLLGVSPRKIASYRVLGHIKKNRAGSYDVAEILRFRAWLAMEAPPTAEVFKLFEDGPQVHELAGRADLPLGETGSGSEGSEGSEGPDAGGDRSESDELAPGGEKRGPVPHTIGR